VSDIYVDGDACPVREEVYRVADRLGLKVFVVSNGSRRFCRRAGPNVSMIVVSERADAADDWIAEAHRQGDICVTSDIPLASRCLAKGARAIAPTGKHWTTEQYRQRAGRPRDGPAFTRTGRGRGRAGAFQQGRPLAVLSALDAAVQAALRQTGRAG